MTQRQASLPTTSGTLDEYINRVASGDTRALESLYRATAPGVYAYALSVLKNSYDAEDVLQETFLCIHKSAGSYRSQEKPTAWIFTIAKNLCMKHLAEQQRYSKTPLEDYELFHGKDESVASEDKLVIEACMKLLTDDERQIVVLHAVSGFKFREIGKMMDLPLSTVLSKYHRSMKKMKANL